MSGSKERCHKIQIGPHEKCPQASIIQTVKSLPTPGKGGRKADHGQVCMFIGENKHDRKQKATATIVWRRKKPTVGWTLVSACEISPQQKAVRTADGFLLWWNRLDADDRAKFLDCL